MISGGLLVKVRLEDLRAVLYGSLRERLNNCLGLCMFLPYSKDQVVEAVRATTGWDTNVWELWKAAEWVRSRAPALEASVALGWAHQSHPGG